MKNNASDFYSKTKCDRCGSSLKDGRTMSMFSTECICMKCKYEEIRSNRYHKEVAADIDEIRKGNYNFEGIGY